MKRMVDPPKNIWLTLGFLRWRFESMNKGGRDKKRSTTLKTYEAIAADYGLSKQQVLNVIDGKTLGLIKFFDVLDLKWAGDFGAMVNDARAWWSTLDNVQKVDVANWAMSTERRRKSAKRGPKSSEDNSGDTEQMSRLHSGLKVPTVPPAPTSKAKKKKKE